MSFSCTKLSQSQNCTLIYKARRAEWRSSQLTLPCRSNLHLQRGQLRRVWCCPLVMRLGPCCRASVVRDRHMLAQLPDRRDGLRSASSCPGKTIPYAWLSVRLPIY